MKRNKVSVGIVLVLVALVATGCVDWDFAERGMCTQRGKSVYDAWATTTYELIEDHGWCFKMNELLAAKTAEDTTDVINAYFTGLSVRELDANVYGIYKGGSDRLEYLIRTNGKSIEETGAKWELLLNPCEDFVYGGKEMGPQRMNMFFPHHTVVYKAIAMDENVVLTSECVGMNKWVMSADFSADKSLGYVNWVLERVPVEVLDVVVSYDWKLSGAGRYTYFKTVDPMYGYSSEGDANELHAHVDYAIEETLWSSNVGKCWKLGDVDFEVNDAQGVAEGFDVRARLLSDDSMQITYAEVTEAWENGDCIFCNEKNNECYY